MVKASKLFTLLVLTLTSDIHASFHDTIYDDCNTEFKACVAFPDDEPCIEDKSCVSLGTVQKYGDKFIFEMHSYVNYLYVAMGLSNDTRMDQDSAMECVKYMNDVVHFTSFTGFDKSRWQTSWRDEVPQNYSKILSRSITNDRIYCQVERKAKTLIRGHTFDLDSQDFYLMLVSGDILTESQLGFHTVRAISEQKINFKDLIDKSKSTSKKLKIKHVDKIYNGCGKTKICFGIPSRCIRDGSCVSIVTVEKGENSKHIFEIKSETNSNYVAAGISTDDKMGNDFVIECVKGKKGIDIFPSLTSIDKSSSNRKNHLPSPLKLLDSSITDGKISCRVSCDSAFNFDYFSFNLTSQQYHIMIATGELLNNDSIGIHVSRAVSKHKINFNKASYVSEKSKFWMQVHGTMMFVAWCGLNSISIFLPRYFRKNWKGKTLFNKDLWFSLHSLLNYGTILLTSIGIIIIFVDLGELSMTKGNFHWLFGLLTFLLSIGQVFTAIIRPSPIHKFRIYWKWAHHVVGYVLQGMATVTIYYTTWLSKLQFHSNMIYFFIGFTGYYLTMQITMTVLDYIQKCSKVTEASTSAEMISLNNPRRTGRNAEEIQKIKKFAKIRVAIFWIYLLVIITYLMAAFIILWTL